MKVWGLLRWAALHGGALGLGIVVASSCADVTYPAVAFRCNPRQDNSCPENYFCCSDDPAAEGGALPNYAGKNIGDPGAPYFSGVNNALGTQGMCVDRGRVPMGAGLLEPGALGCPIPCNPTWSEGDIDVVCGEARECCQTVQLEPEDCVLVDGTWRAVVGTDINQESEAGVLITDWHRGTHRTHQDPDGVSCTALAGGDQSNPVFEDCVHQLTVADQRGFCIALDANQTCATRQPGFVSACEQLNAGAG